MKPLFALVSLFVLSITSSCNQEKMNCIQEDKIDPTAMCTQQYDPVCGCNKQTYGNACIAENAGVTSWESGECPKN